MLFSSTDIQRDVVARIVEECDGCSIQDNFGVAFEEVFSESECQEFLFGIYGVVFTPCEMSYSVKLKSYYYEATYKNTETIQFKIRACLGDDCEAEKATCGVEYWGDYNYEDCELEVELSRDKCRRPIGDNIDCEVFVFGGDPCNFIFDSAVVNTAFDASCKELEYYDGSDFVISQTRGNSASDLAVSLAALISAIAVLQF
tara:strand:- start:388 stop:990 length:603 start_codon:yes stop_codon:yes gene_type:complete